VGLSWLVGAVVAEIDILGVFLGRTRVFGGGWYGYTGQNILALYGR
jgi:hypothetical protein